MSPRPRILVASAERTECDAICDWLRAEGIDPVPARALEGALRLMDGAPLDAIIAGGEIAFKEQVKATRAARQARAPIIALTADRAAEAAADRAGFLSSSRPIDRDMLMCSVTMALAESRPARRSRRKAVAMIDAVAEGIPAAVVDVSNEGLRLHLPRGHRPLPPVFTVKVPLVGIVLSVQRCWTGTSAAPGAPAVSVCGTALGNNPPVREQAWRRFVDVVPTRQAD
jgi:hypothetical protein